MTLDVYERQVPLQPMFDYVDSPSTTTIAFRFITVKAERTPSTRTRRTTKFVHRRQVNDYRHSKTQTTTAT